MGVVEAQDVLVVPADRRLAMLQQRDAVLVQSEDTDGWERPTKVEDSLLADYLEDRYEGSPKRFWCVRVGTRIGFNDQGVFLHENHQKRYFGLESAKASAVLRHGMQEAVPKVNAKGELNRADTSTETFLGSLLTHLPTISDELRYRVLHASFQRADRNNNGKLSRPELGIVLRRVLSTLPAVGVEEVLREADTDSDGHLNYQEFVAWLQNSGNDKIQKAFGTSLRNEADIVRATFRLWDKNGDGLVPDGHLAKALAECHPDLSRTQVIALVKTMDVDHDGNVDYDEFVDFLFRKPGERGNS